MRTSNTGSLLERKLVHHCSPTLAGLKPANLFVCREGIKHDADLGIRTSSSPEASCERNLGPKPHACNSTPESRVHGFGLQSRRENYHSNPQTGALAPEPCRFSRELATCRAKLEPCGVRIEILARRKTGLLLYVYRPTMLKANLAQADVARFLEGEGYNPADLSACITKLHRRICGTDLAATLSESCAFPHEIGFFLGYPYDDVIGFIENKGENCLCTGCWKVYSRQRDAQACFCCYKTCTAAYEDLYDEGVPIDCLACLDENFPAAEAFAAAG